MASSSSRWARFLEGLPVGGIEGIFRSEPAQRHDRSLELQALAADLSGHSLSKHDEGLEHAAAIPRTYLHAAWVALGSKAAAAGCPADGPVPGRCALPG